MRRVKPRRMAVLSSASTFDEVIAEFMDTMSYREDSSVTKAQRFVTACTYLIVLRPKESTKSRTSFAYEPAEVRRMLDDAKQYVSVKSTSSKAQRRVLQVDCTDYRT